VVHACSSARQHSIPACLCSCILQPCVALPSSAGLALLHVSTAQCFFAFLCHNAQMRDEGYALPTPHAIWQVTSFKKGKTALRGAVASAVKNAGAADAAGAAGASGGAKASGKADAGKDAADAAPSGPMTRGARRGGRRPREEDAAPVSNKRSRAPKFIALAQNTMGDFNLMANLDGESARDTFKYVCLPCVCCSAALLWMSRFVIRTAPVSSRH
jgi:hypothetical protein